MKIGLMMMMMMINAVQTIDDVFNAGENAVA